MFNSRNSFHVSYCGVATALPDTCIMESLTKFWFILPNQFYIWFKNIRAPQSKCCFRPSLFPATFTSSKLHAFEVLGMHPRPPIQHAQGFLWPSPQRTHALPVSPLLSHTSLLLEIWGEGYKQMEGNSWGMEAD